MSRETRVAVVRVVATWVLLWTVGGSRLRRLRFRLGVEQVSRMMLKAVKAGQKSWIKD